MTDNIFKNLQLVIDLNFTILIGWFVDTIVTVKKNQTI